jgi:hypothetical protein
MFTYVFFVHDQMIVNKLFLGSKKKHFFLVELVTLTFSFAYRKETFSFSLRMMENISDNQEATFSLVAVLFIMKSV